MPAVSYVRSAGHQRNTAYATFEARGLADVRNLLSYVATKALIAFNGRQFVVRKAAETPATLSR